jgi:hypothetical protein
MSTFHEIHQFQPAIGVIMKKLLLIMLHSYQGRQRNLADVELESFHPEGKVSECAASIDPIRQIKLNDSRARDWCKERFAKSDQAAR